MISNGGAYTAFFDANVLFSPLVTDLILELAVANVYRPRWSQKVHDEWIAAVLQSSLQPFVRVPMSSLGFFRSSLHCATIQPN